MHRHLALAQWEALRDVPTSLGHTVEIVPPAPGLPDMVFALRCVAVAAATA